MNSRQAFPRTRPAIVVVFGGFSFFNAAIMIIR
jgi:hypothetical protein